MPAPVKGNWTAGVGLPQFYGTSKALTLDGFGHVAGAKSLAPELLTRSAAGIDPKAPGVAYCNTGHLASGAWFVMSEILGNRSTRLYDGSMSQWTREKRPVVSVQ